MSRPREGQYAIAHLVVELMRDFDNTKKKNGKSIRLSQLPKKEARALLSVAVGLLLCGLKAKNRAQLFRRVADVLDGKSQASVDDHNMRDAAYKSAQDALAGLFVRDGDRPTFAEFASEFYKLTGRHLTRRDAKRYALHLGKRGAPHGRRKKRKPPAFR